MRRVYSIEELRKFKDRMSCLNTPYGSSQINGVVYSNDWGFGLEAVDKFLDILERMEEKDETTLYSPRPRSGKIG